MLFDRKYCARRIRRIREGLVVKSSSKKDRKKLHVPEPKLMVDSRYAIGHASMCGVNIAGDAINLVCGIV